MQSKQILALTPGTLVQIRPTGLGARDATSLDTIVVAEVLSINVRAGYDRPFKVDGVTVRGGDETLRPDGKAVAIIERQRLDYHDRIAAEPKPVNRDHGNIVRNSAIMAVWDEDTRARVLSERRERMTAAREARKAARDSSARALAQADAERARLRTMLGPGVDLPYIFREGTDPSSYSGTNLRTLAALLDAAYAAGLRDARAEG